MYSLIRRSKRSSNLGWRRLRLVHRDGRAKRANSQPTDKTADRELLPRVGRSDLDEHANHEDSTLYGHCVSATKPVRNPRKQKDRGRSATGNSAERAGTHGAPMSAPKRVPMERRATMRPSRTTEKLHVAELVRSAHEAKRSRKSGIRRMSEIWPVSYY